jgi:predicted Zn-dependent protease
MRCPFIASLALCLAGLLLSGCAYNPLINRDQLILVPESQIVSLAAESWSEIQNTLPASEDQAMQDRAVRVTNRLLSANQKDPSAWTVKVFDDKALNAFALPGDKIGLTSAMISFCQSDDELAAIIGHEMAHVALQHASERLSQDIAMRGAAQVAFPDQARMQSILGIGASLGVLLPYSRQHELEADRLGLRYQSQAGHSPDAAITLWTRMAKSTSKTASPEWLSTHPTSERRIEVLREEIRTIKQEPRS